VVIPETEMTPERLAKEILTLAQTPERIAVMETAAARLGRPEAAREIGEVLSQLAGGSPNPGERASPTRPVED
jgi:UDP-N-acetylglucosamine--N-acetylmuramyl-(pentapeptide) pyrophosphoryl-undecaprenol N-acetylglucosamine transferase